jgi:hypothetical protein
VISTTGMADALAEDDSEYCASCSETAGNKTCPICREPLCEKCATTGVVLEPTDRQAMRNRCTQCKRLCCPECLAICHCCSDDGEGEELCRDCNGDGKLQPVDCKRHVIHYCSKAHSSSWTDDCPVSQCPVCKANRGYDQRHQAW